MKKFFLCVAAMVFSAVSAYAQPSSVTLTSPNGPQVYRAGSSVDIRWVATGWGAVKTANWRFQFRENISSDWIDLKDRNGVALVRSSDTSAGGAATFAGGFRVPGTLTFTGYVRVILVNSDASLNENVADDNDIPFGIQKPEVTKIDSVLKGSITNTVTLKAGKIYGLDGYVYVENGATLRLEPGTVVVGGPVGENSAICINRGGKIYAKGTKNLPIVFTSSAKPGERAAGDWGGILICGRATINTPGGEAALEGGIADAASSKVKGWYGGNDDNDSSGVLEYVRIEFAGIAAFPNEELNSLTMGGVGRRTVLDYIQCSYNNDDAFEWFGGTVNAKHLIAIGTLDDDFDTDFGYRGKVQFALAQRFRQTADASTSQHFESDNNATGTEATPYTQAIFSNVTGIGPLQDTAWTAGSGSGQYSTRFGAAMQIRRNSRMSLFNSVIIGWPAALEILNNSVRAANVDSLQVRNTTFIGVKRVWRSNPAAPLTTAWIDNAAFGNAVINGSGDLSLLGRMEGPFLTESQFFDPRPSANATFLNNASFNQANAAVPIGDSFFERVSYRGAFSATEERWDLGWAEYDPKNKSYEALSAIPTGVTLVSPKSGDVLTAGQTATIKFLVNYGTNTTAKFKVQFAQSASGPWTDVMTSGGTVLTVDANSSNDTTTVSGFIVPNTPTKSGFLRVVLLNADNSANEIISDANDAAFEIKAIVVIEARVTLLSPKGGDVLRAGTSVDITWQSTFANPSDTSLWRFQFSEGADGPWTDLKDKTGKLYVRRSDTAKAGIVTFAGGFRVPAIPTTNGYVRVVKANPADSSLDLTLSDMNDAPFTIIRPEAVAIDSILTGTITGNVSLVNTKIYGLRGYVYVDNGATLNIQAGTVIVGDSVGENSAICVNRGGKIYAKGTRELPIIFTSSAKPGERAAGDWGGILICGRATINTPGGEAALEGGIADAASSKQKGWYGGNDNNDSSGVLEYVRIEFAGIAAFPNEELNSLTLGGVGSRTSINYVQCSFNNDDAFEWFGGTVNAKHLIAVSTLDDDFDTDFGYRGKVQFAVAQRFRQTADASTSQHFESDNNSTGTEATPYTQPVFSNVTGIGPLQDMTWTAGSGATQYSSRFGAAVQIRRNSRMSLFNSVFVGWPSGIQILNNSTRAALNDSVQVKNNTWFGVKTLFGGSPPADNIIALVSNPAAANVIVTSTGNPNADAKLVNPFSFENNSDLGFDPRPMTDATFLNSAAFVKTNNAVAIDDNFFEKVSYRGAFATGGEISARWDKGWTEYDPKNAVYKAQDTVGSGVEEDVRAASTLTIGAYPNPAQYSTKISYFLPVSGNVTIRVFDALGSMNSTYIENVHQFDGYYDFNLNISNLPNGMYFVQVSTPAGVATQSVNVSR